MRCGARFSRAGSEQSEYLQSNLLGMPKNVMRNGSRNSTRRLTLKKVDPCGPGACPSIAGISRGSSQSPRGSGDRVSGASNALPDTGGHHHASCLAVRCSSEYHAHRAVRRAQIGLRVSSTAAGHETQARGGDEKGCRRLLPVSWNGWLIFSAKPRNWLPASISMLCIYSVEGRELVEGDRSPPLRPYLPRSNPSLLSHHRTLQNPNLNDKPVPLEELDRCAARYGEKGTALGQSG